MEDVFNNDLLLDHILKFVIYDGKTHMRNDANTCKLVQRRWLDRVTALYHKTRDYYEYLPEIHCFKLAIDEKETQVDKFIKIFSESPLNRIPPYRLHVAPSQGTTTEDLLLNLETCITVLGTGLVSIVLNIFFGLCDSNDEPIGLTAPKQSLELPNLRKLEVYLTSNRIHVGGSSEKSTTQFIGELLQGCQQLQTFTLLGSSDGLTMLPIEFKALKLPETLREININCCLQPDFIKSLLLHNPLPYLTSLTIRLPNVDVGKDVTNVFNTFSPRLENLEIYGDENFVPNDLQTYISFPKMEKLRKLRISARNYDILENSATSTSNSFPVLQRISLHCQTYNTLNKWMQHYKFDTVTLLTMDLALSVEENNENNGLVINQMRCFKRTFPNITSLNIRIKFSYDLLSFRFVLKEMKNLKRLGVDIYMCDKNASTMVFNSLLIGITSEEVSALEASRDNWDGITIDYEELTSLVNLKELKNLTLSCRGNGNSELITDVAFEFAFLKNLSLEKLCLKHRFRASPEMARKWRDLGRELQL